MKHKSYASVSRDIAFIIVATAQAVDITLGRQTIEYTLIGLAQAALLGDLCQLSVIVIPFAVDVAKNFRAILQLVIKARERFDTNQIE